MATKRLRVTDAVLDSETSTNTFLRNNERTQTIRLPVMGHHNSDYADHARMERLSKTGWMPRLG